MSRHPDYRDDSCGESFAGSANATPASQKSVCPAPAITNIVPFTGTGTSR